MLDPDIGFAYLIRESVKANSIDHQGALADTDKATEIEPFDELNDSMSNLIRKTMGDRQDAWPDLRKAADPEDGDSAIWLKAHY